MRRVLPAGDRALLVELADLDEAERLHAALAAAELPGVEELVPAARTVLVRCDLRRRADVATAIRSLPLVASAPVVGREVEIPVHYDGEDLGEVAAHLGVSAAELVRRHTGAHWRVAFTGFAPGFGYLVCDDPLFDVPRRSAPRVRVPRGAVALAGPYSGVYPRESPGGWQLVGRTDAELWNVDRDPPALLAPGALVRFTVAGASQPARTPSRPAPATRRVDMPGDRSTAPAIEVVDPGLQLLVQDLGRPGRADLGVAESGAADRRAHRAAQHAVGNPPDAAALELLAGGATLRFRGAGVIALAGADVGATLVHPDGANEAVPLETPVAAGDGDELVADWARRGLRTVIAVRGGIALTPELGSLATDTLAGLGSRERGARPLRAGDIVPLRGPAAVREAVAVPSPASPPRLPAAGETVVLRVVLGPRADWFAGDGRRRFLEDEWTVTQRSDRVGVRLEGARGLERVMTGELPSEGTVAGAVQVPPHGHPVVLLRDRPVTGGYPVIACVVTADLDLAAQTPPGARVRFRPTALDVGGPF
ncbi:urea amidolyase family protein [Microbacterium oryzae]|uniref:5-oxoprolinase subunit B/C family protein n=1 Tax=Microbacterium oryzae TaxID=743009 RepID=UPI0025B16CD0|nr:urea amidolyase family protein [Microbacterium oryzae]MDN3310738.1 urea amidolyase family protein [Microbacterium oryzae]